MARVVVRKPPLAWVVGSLVLLSAAVVGTSIATPALRQAVHLRWLTSDDAGRRRQALAYLAAHADERPGLVGRALERVAGAPPAQFTGVVGALDAAGVWTPERVPAEPWLRWLTLVAAEQEPGARLLAIDNLLRKDDVAPMDAAPLLARLLSDDDEEVRLAALLAAADLLGAYAGPDGPLLDLLASATRDRSPLVARHAWLVLGLLRAAPLPPTDPVGPDVFEAAIWAATVTGPAGAERAAQLIAAHDPTNERLPAAVYALSQARAPVDDVLVRLTGSPVHRTGMLTHLAAWRAVLGLRDPATHAQDLRAFAEQWNAEAPDQPLTLATLHALGDPSLADPDRPRQVLAALEGAPPASLQWPIATDASPAVRLAAAAANREVAAADLYPVLRHEDATIRDRAAVLAIDRLSPEDAAGLAERLLREPDIESQMGGAVLAGLLGVHGDLIAQRLSGTPDWPARPMLELAAWMQGAPARIDPALLLLRDDLPRSTVLLAMLHRGRVGEVLDTLLGPHGQPMTDLADLLVTRRWWHVLRRYLPDDAPPVWDWADTRLTDLQIDALRDWAVVQRRARRGHGR